MPTELTPYGRVDRDSPPGFESPVQLWTFPERPASQIRAVIQKDPTFELLTDIPKMSPGPVNTLEVTDKEAVVENYRVISTPVAGGV